MTRIIWVDLLVVIIIIRSSYVGSQRGFFGELFHILGVSLAIICGIHYYSNVSNFINNHIFIPLNISNLLSFLLIIFVIFFVFRIIYVLLQKIIKIEFFPAINKIGGTLLGFCRGIVLSTLIFLIMLLIPIRYIIDSAKTKSMSGSFFIKTGTMLYEKGLGIVTIEPRDLNHFLSGAEPLKFDIFKHKRRDRLEELLE